MDRLLKLTQDVGMKPSQGQDALGGILKLVQSNVSSADFSKIEAAMPGAGSAAANAENKASQDPTAKLMSSAMGMFGGAKKKEGSSTGGPALDSIPQLLAFAAKSGIDAKQLTALLPLVAKFLQSNANVDASGVLGTTASGGGSGAATNSAPGGSTSGGGIDTNNLAQQAQGFLGGFMKK